MSTSVGDMVIELNAKKAPKTVENFLHYVDTKFYDGTIFHRVISNFMVQGGGFIAEGIENRMARPKKPTRDPVVNEAHNGLKNEYGTIAMARLPTPNSATSQFFINVKSNLNLNHRDKSPRGYGYCVFGRVVDGYDTLEKIRNAKVKPLPAMGNKRVLPDPIITIKSVRRTEKPKKAKGE
ncbi:MAG: peptidylprolyl isomerase [Planctomycetota bacterium]